MAILCVTLLIQLVFVTTTRALICGNCDDVIAPGSCTKSVTCGEDQLCGANQVMSATFNELRYRLRCMPKLLCNALGKVPDGNLCARCCDYDLCNTEDCRKTTTIIPTTIAHTTIAMPTRTLPTAVQGSPTAKPTPPPTLPGPAVGLSGTPTAQPTPTAPGPAVGLSGSPTAKMTTTHAPTTTHKAITPSPPPPLAHTSKSVIILDRNNPSDVFKCSVNNSDLLNIYINNQNRIHLRRDSLSSMNYDVTVKEWQNGTVIRCEGVNTVTNQKAHTDVTVYVRGTKPYFPITEEKIITVKDGDNIGLTCIPEGDPTPTITWTEPKGVHQNSVLKSHITYHYDNVELEISNMTSQLVGTYTCAAHNPLGTATYTYIVRYVSGTSTPTTPSVPLLIKPDVFLEKQVTVTEGETTLAIPCTADGIPAPSISWTTSEELMPSNTMQYQNYLIIHNVDFYDSRYYICVATNAAGTTKQAIHVLVKPRPHTMPGITLASNLQVKYGSRVVLKCDVSGFPQPEVKWTINGVDAGRSRDLIINQASMKDIGAYSCTATNHVGSVTKTLVLLVTGTPPSIVTSQPTTITINNNKPVSMQCQASGEPAPTITWTFKAFVGSTDSVQKTVSRDNATYTLANVDKSGTVTCIAANPFGQVQASFSIIAIPQVFGR